MCLLRAWCGVSRVVVPQGVKLLPPCAVVVQLVNPSHGGRVDGTDCGMATLLARHGAQLVSQWQQQAAASGMSVRVARAAAAERLASQQEVLMKAAAEFAQVRRGGAMDTPATPTAVSVALIRCHCVSHLLHYRSGPSAHCSSWCASTARSSLAPPMHTCTCTTGVAAACTATMAAAHCRKPRLVPPAPVLLQAPAPVPSPWCQWLAGRTACVCPRRACGTGGVVSHALSWDPSFGRTARCAALAPPSAWQAARRPLAAAVPAASASQRKTVPP